MHPQGVLLLEHSVLCPVGVLFEQGVGATIMSNFHDFKVYSLECGLIIFASSKKIIRFKPYYVRVNERKAARNQS